MRLRIRYRVDLKLTCPASANLAGADGHILLNREILVSMHGEAAHHRATVLDESACPKMAMVFIHCSGSFCPELIESSLV